MKKIREFLYFFAMFWGVRAFHLGEIKEAICSVPEKYSLRFIGCSIDESPAVFKKISDALHQCVNQFYEPKGKSDSILLILCQDVWFDSNVIKCVNSKEGEWDPPKEQEIEEFSDAVHHCLFNA